MIGNAQFATAGMVLAVRNMTAAGSYSPICDENGQNCQAPCGPDDDPESEICPMP